MAIGNINTAARPVPNPVPAWAMLVLAAAFAALSHASLPSAPSPVLPLLFFVPLALGLRGVRPVQGLLRGWLFGTAGWLAAVWWVARGMGTMLGWPAPWAWVGALLLCLFQGLPFAGLGLGCGLVRLRGREAGPVFCAALLTLLVFLRPPLCPGSAALSLYKWPLAIQTADLGGVSLVLFLQVLAGWLAALALTDLFCAGGRGRAGLRLAVLAVLLGGVFAYGAWRLDQFHALERAAGPDEFVRIATVQPVVIPRDASSLKDSGPYAGCLGALKETTERGGVDLAGADLVLWPEVPCDIDCDCGEFRLDGVPAAAGAPILLDCVERDYGANEPVTETRTSPDGGTMAMTRRTVAAQYNSLWLVGPDGSCGRAYRKVVLMPFGERTPLREAWPWLQSAIGRKLEYSAGPGPTLVTTAHGRRVQPLLCFESGFSPLVRQGVAMGAQALVNLSDDAWFGSARASELHLALALYRTVEFRRPLVSATDSGFGAHVRATGEIVPGTLTPAWERAVTMAPLHCPGATTPYARFGDWLPWACAGLVLLGLARPRRRRGD